LTEDEEGQDSKIIAIPVNKIDPTFSFIKDVQNIPESLKNQIEHFFTHYKELEGGKYVRIKGWGNKQMAETKITEAIERYTKT
jgi:inorganic pyrophosphatase